MLSRKRISGFSFLELMLVLVILAIVAMAAIPNYMRFKKRQDVASAAFGVQSDFINARTIAEREERVVEVNFQQDSESKFVGPPYRYLIIKDMVVNNYGNSGTGDSFDLDFRDSEGNMPALVKLRRVTEEFGGKVYLWGPGMINGSTLRFQVGGKPTSETLTFISETNGGYYSIFISSEMNVNAAGYTSEVRIYWDGRVVVINDWENK